MLIRNSKAFIRGLLLMISFIAVFCVFFMPVFPGSTANDPKVTGLVYADHLFNTLSKGSSNFFDSTATNKESVQFRIKGVAGKTVSVEIPFKKTQDIPLAKKLVEQAGLTAIAGESTLKIEGDLHALLMSMTNDSQEMFANNGAAVSNKHDQVDAREIMACWWTLATSMVKPLQKLDHIAEAKAVSVVIGKAIEPSYNFYGIEPLRVGDNIPLVAGFLIFYVVYTMWYGFAIFELFEGVGLTMKKSIKQEV